MENTTFEVNLYVDPLTPIWLKALVTFPWLISVFCAFFLLAAAKFELEGSMGHYRPVINQLTSFTNVTGFLYILIVTTIDWVRFIFGPLPVALCDGNYIVKIALGNSVVFLILFISCAKFMFICVWKNIPSLDDSFIAFYLTLVAWMFGLMSAFVKSYSPGRPVFNQAYCYGIYHRSWELMQPKLKMEALVAGIPFLTHIVLTICITIAKSRHNQVEPHVQGTADRRDAPKSMGNMLQNFLLFCCFCIANTLFANLNYVGPEKWSQFPYIVYHIYNHFFIASIFASIATFVQWKSIKQCLNQ